MIVLIFIVIGIYINKADIRKLRAGDTVPFDGVLYSTKSDTAVKQHIVDTEHERNNCIGREKLRKSLEIEFTDLIQDYDNLTVAYKQRIEIQGLIISDYEKRVEIYKQIVTESENFYNNDTKKYIEKLEKQAIKQSKWYNKFWFEFTRDFLIIGSIGYLTHEISN